MATIENTRLYRETVRVILEDWDEIMKRDGTDTCPICYRREYMSEASADQAGYRDDFCELCDEIFPEIVKARSVNDRSGPCPCFVLKDEAAVISRACAYVDDPEKEGMAMKKLSVVEQITASKEYQAYMAAALVALRKRNVTTQEHKKTYWMLTGEGEVGTWKRHICTLRGIQRIATRERCGGDRWATIWEEIPETDTTEAHIINIDSGDIRYIPDED